MPEIPTCAAPVSRHELDVFFSPRSVALIGATDTPREVGRSILWNLISSPFGGTVYPINAQGKAVLGIRSYPSVTAVPEPVDLAVVVALAETVPGVIRECATAGVTGAVLISAGFREAGDRGLELERKTLEIARAAGIRLIGPNCLGVMCTVSGLNATFAPAMARRGSVALISQSGALCSALLDWSAREHIGFSSVLSVGSMLDVSWGSLIDYLGSDPNTQSIVIYMESIGDARAFLSAAREVALDKPILVIRAGRSASQPGPEQSVSCDAILDAAFRRVGVLRIDELADIFHMTEVLAWQPRPAGPKLTIVTNAGGPGLLAADAAISSGGELAQLAPQSIAALQEFLPSHWRPTNPVDILGEADPTRYEKAVEIAGKDSSTDGLLVIMTPQAMSDPVEVANRVARFSHLDHRPILASWMGGVKASEGEAILNRARIPTFSFPDDAVRAFLNMWRYSYNVRSLYETPTLTARDPRAVGEAGQLLGTIRASGRTELSVEESERLLNAYGIVTYAPPDAGSLQLFVGSRNDDEFGPVLLFGVGGPIRKLLPEYAVALPPLNTTLARRFMEQSRVFHVLKTLDLSALENLLVNFSQLVMEQNCVREITIDPLLLAGDRPVALRGTVVLYGSDVDLANASKPAIRPYPAQHIEQILLSDGTRLQIRPIRPEDEPLIAQFHLTLSEQTVYRRYFSPMKLESRVRHERLTRMCFIDYDRQMALVAEALNGEAKGRIVGVGRLIKSHTGPEAELAAIVSDDFQRRGIGTVLVNRLIAFARAEKLHLLTAYCLAENTGMQSLLERQGFRFPAGFDPDMQEGRLTL